MEYWVFGADGYVGQYICRKTKEANKKVIACSRRNSSEFEKWVAFDICDDNKELWQLANNNQEKTAIICVAKSNIDVCKIERDKCYEINVYKTIELISQLRKYGFYIIFLSTDNVFSGNNEEYTEDSIVDPLNEYGKMKVLVERYIRENIPEACIFRLAKVVGPYSHPSNIFTQWEQHGKGVIKCIKNNKLNFISLEDIYNVIQIASDVKLSGIYHIVGDENISRAELAAKYLKKVKCESDIVEIDVNNFGFVDNHIVRLNLSNKKIKEELNYRFLSCDEMIEHYIEKKMD